MIIIINTVMPTFRPVDKDLIVKYKEKLYVPYFITEDCWQNENTNSWFRCLKYTYDNDTNFNKSLCGVDIGCKNFITLYGANGLCYRIVVDEQKINNILINKNISYAKKDKKIKNLINELHIKTAILICRNFHHIYIGQTYTVDKIDSKSMKSTVDNLSSILSHNRFLKILYKYAKKTKKNINIVDESFTSKHCGECGELKSKFNRIMYGDDSERRKYICDFCNAVLHRDVNAARIIIIKNIN